MPRPDGGNQARGHIRGTTVTSLPSMTWYWRLEDPSGATVDPATIGVDVPRTDSQGDAESWLGENWRELLDSGVATVTLFDDEIEIYGPMGLAAP
jgi:hypothetical protein